MGSIISAINDKIREHGSIEKYQEHLWASQNNDKMKSQNSPSDENNIELSLDERVIIKLNDKHNLHLVRNNKGIKVIADIGRSFISVKPESDNSFTILISDPK